MSFKLLVLLTSALVGSGLYAINAVQSSTERSVIEQIDRPVIINTAPTPSPAAPAAKSSKEEFSKLHRLHISDSQIIRLDDVVNEATASKLVRDIKTKGKGQKDLYLLINSPGGSVLDGALVLSAIEGSKARVHTVRIGMCASMAFVIHQYGYTRLALNRSILMAHPASGSLSGSLEEMQSLLGTISRFVDKMNADISKRAGLSLSAFKTLEVSQFWIDAEDAKKQGFVDMLVDIPAQSSPVSIFMPESNAQYFKREFKFVW